MSSPAQVTMFGVRAPREAPGRFPSKKAALRWLLSDHEWHGWRELMKAVGPRYGARLFELKAEGLPIERELSDEGGSNSWEYRWTPPRPEGGAR